MTDEEFLALEREGWDALSSSRGAGYYRGCLFEDALMPFPFGVTDRTQAIDAIACAQPWSGSEITSPRVVQVGEGRDRGPLQRERPARGEPTFDAVVSSTFVRRGSDWRLAFLQQSPIS